jgi:WD40 repeat protein
MASLTSLKVSITKATPIEDHSTYRYHILLQCGEAKWEVTKRFSEFDGLLQSLAQGRYGGLPKLPSKTLLGSPTDVQLIEERKQQLRMILHDLLFRPDTRTSQQLRQFLALDSHAEVAVRSVQPDAMRTFEDPRFGVSGVCAVPQSNLLFVTHEDSTHLSRLGRVWSVVEPDELGALHLWSNSSDGSWKRLFSKTFGIKARSLSWEDNTRQCFVGLEDGKIEVYSVPRDTMQPTLVVAMEVHHKSPVTHLSASPRRLLSLGFDTALRVIDVKSRQPVCGGRLAKRLKSESDYLTTGYLDDEQDRAFVGTYGGDMLILGIEKNPPQFLHSIELTSAPVTAMCRSKETFLIAHGDCVSVYSYESKGQERRISRLGCHRSKHLNAEETSILSLDVAPSRRLIFGGFSDGSVAIWLNREAEAFMVLHAHQCDTTCLAWIDSAPWGPALMTGGGDGKVVTWSLAGTEEDYTFWHPQFVDSDDAAPSIAPLADVTGLSDNLGDMSSAFEPTWGTSSDLFRIDNPRVNPQALRQGNESDSDDDIVNAFR